MKRLVICCDGTWNQATEEDKITNIVRLRRVITPRSEDGTLQAVFYDTGIGTDGRADAISGGMYGEGMDKNVLDAYGFLVDNYEAGDELFFFGFSRGAYTVRSLVGLINNAGLLKKENASKLSDAYALYRSKDPLDRPHGERGEYFRAMYSREVKVKFLGVFDTVGALGIPLIILGKSNAEKYGFHDTTLSRIVENAYHALAIDEWRYHFLPTLWRAKEGTKSEQRWFPGSHSDVGGGYKEHGLSDLSLRWMLTKSHECGLNYDLLHNYAEFAPSATATMHNSYASLFSLLGKHARHVCDTVALNRHSVLIPHDFDSAHSWFRRTKDKMAPHAPIPWWNIVARIRAWFSRRSVCEMTDMSIDTSVLERKSKLGYAPSNLMPTVFRSPLTPHHEGGEQPDMLAGQMVFASRPRG